MDSEQGKTDNFSFSLALNYLKSGEIVQRAGWNGADQYLELQHPDENSKMTLPYIYITTVHGDLVPWLASQSDLLSDDWRILLDYRTRHLAAQQREAASRG